MKNNWPVKKLREVASVFTGFAFDSSYFTSSKEKGIPLIRIRDVRNATITETNYCGDFKDNYLIDNNSILITMDGEFISAKWKGGRALLNQRVATLNNFNSVLKDWLFYLINDELKKIQDKSYQTTVKHISPKQILDINVPSPSLNIQKKIVERLDSIRKAQELCDQQIQKTEELFESILSQALRENWPKIKLNEAAEINPRKNEVNDLPDDLIVTFLAMADVSEDAEIINKQERKLKEVKKGFTYFKDGDILVAKITPCFENGKGAFAEDLSNNLGFGSTEFHVLRANTKIIGKFLFYILNDKNFRNLAKNAMTGSTGQQRVPKDYLENFEVKLPPIQKQQKIVEKLEVVQNYKKLLIKQRELFKELFDSVLDKSMKGELDI